MVGLVVALAAGCAAVPPLSDPKAIQPADLASLAGEWQGRIYGSFGTPGFRQVSRSLRLTFEPNGTFRSNIDGIPGQGTARLVDGRLVYEGSGNRGTASLHERGGRPVIRGEGTLVGASGWSAFEVSRP